MSDLVGVRNAAGGNKHNLALKDDGTVWAWGGNLIGELGIGTTTKSSSTPVQVGNLDGVKTIAAGLAHSLAVQ